MTRAEFRALRLRLGYTLSQAAEAVGQWQSSVGRAETGDPDSLVPGAMGRALEYHARLLEIGAIERVPAPKQGRPAKVR